MKIASENYTLSSSYQAYSYDETRQSLHAWTGNNDNDRSRAANETMLASPPVTAVSIGSAARQALEAEIRNFATQAQQDISAAVQQTATTATVGQELDATENDPVMQLIKGMIEMMTGIQMKLFSASELQPAPSAQLTPPPSSANSRAIVQSNAPAPNVPNWGMRYEEHHIHEEYQQLNLASSGVIKTTDGLEISFKLELSITQLRREESNTQISAGNAVRRDPLALNFNGKGAQLSDQLFAFDLLGNGKSLKIPVLVSGSGYLTLDQNGNGRIDSGRELFGPGSNAGFAELASLDSDGNHWIDENDADFAKLRIWTPAVDGTGTLESLSKYQIGALSTQSVASPFELRGTNNRDQGALTASGLFLQENGKPGWIQEVDLSV